MQICLLDVNVLPALAWPNHQFHHAARARMSGAGRWASRALTQLGFVRLSMTPAVVRERKPIDEAMGVLAGIIADPRHEYWGELPAPEAEDFRWVHGGGQVTDAYLLALAQRHGARLLTFDARLRHLGAGGGGVEVLGV